MKTSQAMRLAKRNKSRRTYPGRDDPRYVAPNIFPEFRPRWGIDFASRPRVFTIGSCFARNVEEQLVPLGIEVPTAAFSVPPVEFTGGRVNGILNEYNPGTMGQRITDAMLARESDPSTLFEVWDGYRDLLLRGTTSVSLERALERRREVFELYTNLPKADVVIITLGLVEAWQDRESGVFLNIMPPNPFASEIADRYEIHRMDVPHVLACLEPAIAMLEGKRVVVTVSPAPLRLTFTDDDCSVANEFSKSVLRVCADRLRRRYDFVDYFPSYEIVRSGGTASYANDNAHVDDDLVMRITQGMVQAYQTAADTAAR